MTTRPRPALTAVVVAALVAASPVAARVRLLAAGDVVRLEFEAREGDADSESCLLGLPPGASPEVTVVAAEGSGRPVVLGTAGWVRRQRVVPVVFAPDGGYSRVVAEIRLGSSPRGGPLPPSSRLEEGFYAGALINPRQSRPWRSPPPAAAPRPAAATTRAYKIALSQTGIYRLTGRDVPQLMGAASGQVALYTSEAGGGPLSPATDTLAAARRPVGIVVDDGGDGRFDAGDELLFFGRATSDWVFAAGAWHWRQNPYTAANAYWLIADDAAGAVRWPDSDGAPGTGAASGLRQHYRARLHEEVESEPIDVAEGGIRSGTDWYWAALQPGDSRTFAPVARSPVAGQEARLRLRFASRALNGDALLLSWNGRRAGEAASAQPGRYTWEGTAATPRDGVNELSLFHQRGSQALLDWYELEFDRRLEAERGQLLFEGAEAEPSTYELRGFVDEQPLVLAVSADGDLVRITGSQADPSTGMVRFAQQGRGPGWRYAALGRSQLRRPEGVEPLDPDRLLRQFAGAEYLVLAPPEFLDAAGDLADWRGRDDRFGPPLSSAAVDVQAVYDAFSGGLLDPTAIRNFLGHAYRQGRPAPLFAVLLGDGTYDYRNNGGANRTRNWIPPYEEGTSTYDEWYARVAGADALADMAVGRLPAGDAEEARAMVAKLVDYDRDPDIGLWQSRVLLVADDTYNADQPGRPEVEFTVDAEELAARYLPFALDVDKLYLSEYPREGRFKPRARDAFVERLNRGAVLLTWVGHGNSQVFAHEHIFVLSSDLDAIANGPRLPFIYAAASQMGVFDDPARDSVPEAFLKRRDGGAVGMIAATRIGFHTSNMELARNFHERLFADGPEAEAGEQPAAAGPGGHVPVGMALWQAKLVTHTNLDNVRRYSLFGDPAMRLAIPRLGIELSAPDTLQALDVITVTGEVTGMPGAPSDFRGQVQLTVFDSASRLRRVEQGVTLDYDLPGAVLYRGLHPVDSGRFAARVPVPRDITYRGRSGRVSAQAVAGEQVAFGAAGPLVLSGTRTDAAADDDGPRIDIGFAGQAFGDGDPVGDSAVLVARLSDDSGINVTGEVGHGIALYVDERRFDLTALYQAIGDYRSGEVRQPLPPLEAGPHSVRLEAWDTRNNWGARAVTVRVAEPGQVRLADLLVHPSPLSGRSATFTYQLEGEVTSVRVAVYSVAGRLVAAVDGPADAGYNQVAWNAPPDLANGIYVVEAAARGPAGSDRATTALAVAR